MLQILAIRQAFIVAEWLLILLLMCGATFLFINYVAGRHSFAADAQYDPELDVSSGPTYALAQVKSRQEYEAIVAAGLFGPAGQTATDAVAAAAAGPVEVTELNLQLCGTAATSPKDIYASAIIHNKDNETIQAFGVGDQVVDQVLLEEIHQRKVILFNRLTNRREVLYSDAYDDQNSTGPALPAGSQPAQSPGMERVTIKKTEIIQELMTNYADIVSQIKPELYRDENNNVVGITASNLGRIPLAAKLGVQEGDVLQSVNNEPIDSEQKVMELIEKYRNANVVRVGLLRQGRPVFVTVRLE